MATDDRGMGSDLQLDPSTLNLISNPVRSHAAVTVADRVADKWPVTEILQILGLVEKLPTGGYVATCDEDGVPWTPAQRPGASAVIARVRTLA